MVHVLDDSATIMSLIQSDPHVNGRYKPFSSKIEAMAYLIAHCPRPMVSKMDIAKNLRVKCVVLDVESDARCISIATF